MVDRIRKRIVTGAKWILAIAIVVGQLLLAALLSPILIAFLALALLLARLPIPQIRTAILAAQSTLTATVGDSFAFVESPVRAALIRTCILDGLARLKPHCEHTMIVAHSQGAAAVIDALIGMNEKGKPETASRVVPDALVTFGAGTKKLAFLSAGPSMTFGRRRISPVSAGVGGLWGAVVVVLWLYFGELEQTMCILLAGLVLLLGYVVLAIVMEQTLKRQVDGRIVLGTLLFMFLGMYLLVWRLTQLSLVHLSMLSLPVLYIVFSIYLILLMKGIVAPVRKPPGLVRWVDLYASADPVPNGPTRTDPADGHESIKVWNLGSIVADHTAYWDNRDGFVLRVAKVCAETAKSPWLGALPREPGFVPGFVDKRAAWRVGFLMIARWSTAVTWVVLGVILWARYKASIPVTFLPSWVPAAPVRPVLLVTFIASAMWATYGALRWLWDWWVRAEQEAVLAHDKSGGKSHEWYVKYVIFFMGLVVGMLIAATYLLMKTNSWAELESSLTDADERELGFVIAYAFLWTFVAALPDFVLWLKRPPDASGSSDRGSIP